VTNASGVATITSWTLGTTAGANTLQATSGALTPVNFSATGTAGAAAALVFTQQPSNTTAGQPITPAVVVTVHDAFGNTVTGFGNDVTITIAVDPTGGTAALTGTTTVTPSAGVALFSNLMITPAADGFRLGASASGLPTGQSILFNVTP
jgi:hypothetical protein